MQKVSLSLHEISRKKVSKKYKISKRKRIESKTTTSIMYCLLEEKIKIVNRSKKKEVKIVGLT